MVFTLDSEYENNEVSNVTKIYVVGYLLTVPQDLKNYLTGDKI